MNEWPAALSALAAFPHFILWRAVADGARTTKKPLHPKTGEVHNPLDPTAWVDVRTAMRRAKHFACGVGFVFNKDNPFWFIDIDKCLTDAGAWNTRAVELCTQFSGCAVEVSQSGTGLHIFGSGLVPTHSCKNQRAGLELYTEDRFVALTGVGAVGDAMQPAPTGVMAAFVAEYFTPTVTAPESDWRNSPVDQWAGIQDDTLLIEKMLASHNASSIFGTGVSISALWHADEATLGRKYPDVGGRSFDHNSADAALCAHLAFWTGKDSERMDLLFRQSALSRDKWTEREDYRFRTISFATSHCKTVYSSARAVAASSPMPSAASSAAPEIIQRSGFQFLSIDDQRQYFKGFVYVVHDHVIFTPSGVFYKPEQFKAKFGGYVFALDAQNEATTRNAWEAFTQTQGLTFPSADVTCFRPDQPSGDIITEEGWSLVNTYVPIKTERTPGDVSRFLELTRKLFPVPGDWASITAYMAACVQYPGVKFRWAPLVQGVQGNGKSFIAEAIAHAVGWRYTHKPHAQDIGNTFNAWIRNRLFIIVEEVMVKDKREVMEALKTLISDEKGPITPKGVDQFTGDNRANFWCNTNHKDALRIAGFDRRWAIFYTPQQTVGDLVKDGLAGDYFPNLYNWARHEGGHAVINDFLFNYKIPDALNPATLCHRGPSTSSTEEAITLSLGSLEQDILECIEQEKCGFRGGWVSSIALDGLIKDRRETKLFSVQRRKDILGDLGYIPHPALPGGRASSVCIMDGGRPRLYVKKGHPSTLSIRRKEATALYVKAQLPEAPE